MYRIRRGDAEPWTTPSRAHLTLNAGRENQTPQWRQCTWFCSFMDFSGVSIMVEPSCGDWNSTPCRCIALHCIHRRTKQLEPAGSKRTSTSTAPRARTRASTRGPARVRESVRRRARLFRDVREVQQGHHLEAAAVCQHAPACARARVRRPGPRRGAALLELARPPCHHEVDAQQHQQQRWRTVASS